MKKVFLFVLLITIIFSFSGCPKAVTTTIIDQPKTGGIEGVITGLPRGARVLNTLDPTDGYAIIFFAQGRGIPGDAQWNYLTGEWTFLGEHPEVDNLSCPMDSNFGSADAANIAPISLFSPTPFLSPQMVMLDTDTEAEEVITDPLTGEITRQINNVTVVSRLAYFQFLVMCPPFNFDTDDVGPVYSFIVKAAETDLTAPQWSLPQGPEEHVYTISGEDGLPVQRLDVPWNIPGAKYTYYFDFNEEAWDSEANIFVGDDQTWLKVSRVYSVSVE